jgi:hypothetical protein
LQVHFSENPIIDQLIIARSDSWYGEKFDVAFFGCGNDDICLMGGIDIQMPQTE